MIHYKQMAEVARQRDRWHKMRVDRKTLAPDAEGPFIMKEDIHDQPMSDADLKTFWQRFQDAKIFVFDQDAWPIPSEVPASEEPELNVPFQSCFFENLPQGDEDYLMKIGADESDTAFIGILLYEIEPGKYDVYALGKRGEGKRPSICFFPWEPGIGNLLAWVNCIWLDRLNRSDLGVEHVNEKIKIGSGTGQKQPHKIRQIIRVLPRHQRERAQPVFSREIDWTHRWTVRGHWRRHDGLGKNRAGEYCVQGFTWVNDFVKGPENAPLIEKVRFVPEAAP